TKFISSGYSALPYSDNMFAASNDHAKDSAHYNVIQPDLNAPGPLRPLREHDLIALRTQAAPALQPVFAGTGSPPPPHQHV
ncbi:propanediol dehydratase, partial [Klebsiella pneumoniae]|uniref:propanediol/glycerol family dehydratase large subunit n=1 Tax=Klebsiella pneumoniae TaxID=573 RepID=UPI002B1BDBAA